MTRFKDIDSYIVHHGNKISLDMTIKPVNLILERMNMMENKTTYQTLGYILIVYLYYKSGYIIFPCHWIVMEAKSRTWGIDYSMFVMGSKDIHQCIISQSTKKILSNYKKETHSTRTKNWLGKLVLLDVKGTRYWDKRGIFTNANRESTNNDLPVNSGW